MNEQIHQYEHADVDSLTFVIVKVAPRF